MSTHQPTVERGASGEDACLDNAHATLVGIQWRVFANRFAGVLVARMLIASRRKSASANSDGSETRLRVFADPCVPEDVSMETVSRFTYVNVDPDTL